MLRRFHEALMNGVRVWTFVNVFGKSQVKRAPAARALAGRPGSPGNWCATVPCAAISSACFRAALAKASSDLQRWQSVGFAFLVHRMEQFALRVRALALRHGTSAEENQYSDQNRYLMWIFHGTSPAI